MVHELTRTSPPDSSAPMGPVRMCVGCRGRAIKSELLRIVIGSDSAGQLVAVPDPEGTAAGRGAYLHPTIACFEQAIRRRSFSRALRAEVGGASAAVRDHVAELGRLLDSPTT